MPYNNNTMPIQLSKEQKLEIYRTAGVKQELAIVLAVEMMAKQMQSVIDEMFKKAMPEMIDKAQEFKLGEITERLTRSVLNDIKGEPGYSPVKGVDYMTKSEINDIAHEILEYARPRKGEDYMTMNEKKEFAGMVLEIIGPIKDGKTPKAGVDYITPKQSIKIILAEVKKFTKSTGRTIESMNSEKIKENLGTDEYVEVIARAIERLPLDKKLDYNYGLKNQPGVKLYDEKQTKGQKRLGRGTGSDVRAYDLSGLLNGVLKTFTIPSNSRVLSVTSSSFPTTFRPTVDYTTTGTTITFTSEVDAGTTLSAGQTLVIVYVE